MNRESKVKVEHNGLDEGDITVASAEKVKQLKEVEKAEKFIAEVAKKCGVFFEWTSDQSSRTLAEQLWKN